jgi:hypothetical protein
MISDQDIYDWLGDAVTDPLTYFTLGSPRWTGTEDELRARMRRATSPDAIHKYACEVCGGVWAFEGWINDRIVPNVVILVTCRKHSPPAKDGWVRFPRKQA